MRDAGFNDAKDRGDEARRSEKYLEAARCMFVTLHVSLLIINLTACPLRFLDTFECAHIHPQIMAMDRSLKATDPEHGNSTTDQQLLS